MTADERLADLLNRRPDLTVEEARRELGLPDAAPAYPSGPAGGRREYPFRRRGRTPDRLAEGVR